MRCSPASSERVRCHVADLPPAEGLVVAAHVDFAGLASCEGCHHLITSNQQARDK